MLEKDKFLERLIIEFGKTYPLVEVQGEYIKIGNENSNLTIPFMPIFQQYKLDGNFIKIVEKHSMIIDDILNQHKYSIDYNSVYPVLRNNSIKNSEIKYFQKELFEDVGLYFVQDMGETIRFVLETDEGIDFEKLEQEAFINLNRLTNALSKIDGNFDIYTLKFMSDYASSMILNKSIVNQIHKKVGQDFLFCIPSASTLIIAKYRPQYIEIIKSLIAIDQDPNKISNEVFRYKSGFYTALGEDRKAMLRLVK